MGTAHIAHKLFLEDFVCLSCNFVARILPNAVSARARPLSLPDIEENFVASKVAETLLFVRCVSELPPCGELLLAAGKFSCSTFDLMHEIPQSIELFEGARMFLRGRPCATAVLIPDTSDSPSGPKLRGVFGHYTTEVLEQGAHEYISFQTLWQLSVFGLRSYGASYFLANQTLIVLNTLVEISGITMKNTTDPTYPNPSPPVAMTHPGICGCQWNSLT